jgi:hypothetical protein
MGKKIFTAAPAGAILILAGWALLLSCAKADKGVGPLFTSAEPPYEVVHGTTYDRGDPPQEVPNTRVRFDCLTCGEILLEDFADHAGYYALYSEEELSEHNGHTLRGYASHPENGTDTQDIPNFQWANIPYTVDFYLGW